jgi:peptidoglycan/LPS O-acetylase OafA/YrhL
LQVAEVQLERQTRIPELDGWRAVSVMLVIGSHLSIFRFRPWFAHHLGLTRFWVYAGPLGVKTFFVISGFVICRLMLTEEARVGFVSFRGFYIRRAFRILPALYLMLATTALLQMAGWIDCDWTSLLFGGLFLTNLNLSDAAWFTGHTWSLCVEEQFYLLFPLLWFLTRLRREWRGPLFLCLFAVFALWNLIWHANFTVSGVSEEHFFARSRTGFSCICAGVLVAIWEERARRFAARVPGWTVLLIGLILLANPVHRDTIPEAFYQSLLVPMAIALILMHSVVTRGNALRAFLCSRPMQTVGLMSYGAYLWQQLFTGRPISYFGAGTAIANLAPLLLVVVPISYFLVEKPAMRLGKTLSRQVQPSATLNA